MDANYVHQRDVSNILASLHQQIDEVNKLKEKDSTIPQEEINKKLQFLISSADRDLRLKTQSIMRTRLAQSKTIPVNFAPLVQLDGNPFQTPYAPFPESESQDKIILSSKTSTPRVKKESNSVLANVSHQTPIKKLTTTKGASLSDTSHKTARRSNISDKSSNSSSRKEVNPKGSLSSKGELTPKSAPSRLTRNDSKVIPKSTKLSRTDSSRKVVNQKSSKGPMTNRSDATSTLSSIRRQIPERPKTAISTCRKRNIPDYIPKLPKVDRHDPKAEPPPISDNMVDKYGLQQLTETRLLKDDDIPPHLKGLVLVSPFRKDIAADYRNFKQNYYIDPVKPPVIVRERPKVDMLNIPSDEDDAALSTATGHYIFSLINGRPNPSSQEFQNFRLNYSNMWESIEIILNMLLPICEQYGLSEIKVDGNVIAEFTKSEPDEIPAARLFRCFMTVPRRKKISSKFGFGFVGPNAQDKAATLIQSIWRGYNARRVVRMIRRHNVAAKIIQSKFRVIQLSHIFMRALEKERTKKMMRFDAIQVDNTSYRPSEPHLLVHLVGSFDGVEIGRLACLQNKYACLVLYFRKAPSTEIVEMIRSLISDTNRIHIMTTSLKLPINVSIEDLFASDLPSMKQVRGYAGSMPIIIVPTRIHFALVDSSIKLNALALVPSPVRLQMYESRESMRRILKNAGTELFESSAEIFDNDSLCKEIAGLAVMNIKIQTWVLHANDGSIAWLNTSDLILIDQLRAHKEALTEEDLIDKSFRDLLKQNIQKELKHILNTTGETVPEQFLRNFITSGGTVEAGPQHIKSAPAVAFYVPPIGRPEIVGSWEVIYISTYEPFASIHPAFTVKREKLKKRTLKIAAECSSKRLIGTSVVQYFYSARNMFDSEGNEEQMQMKLTPDNLKLGELYEILPQYLVNTLLKISFDEESMSIGPSTYTYVQKKLVFPELIEYNELKDRCIQYNIPVDEKVFLVPSLNDSLVYSFLVFDETPERLINLVYRTLVTLSDNVFDLEKLPNSDLLSYISAIEYLKQQYETTNDISSTVLMKKLKPSQFKKVREQRVFLFAKLKEESQPAQEQDEGKIKIDIVKKDDSKDTKDNVKDEKEKIESANSNSNSNFNNINSSNSNSNFNNDSIRDSNAKE